MWVLLLSHFDSVHCWLTYFDGWVGRAWDLNTGVVPGAVSAVSHLSCCPAVLKVSGHLRRDARSSLVHLWPSESDSLYLGETHLTGVTLSSHSLISFCSQRPVKCSVEAYGEWLAVGSRIDSRLRLLRILWSPSSSHADVKNLTISSYLQPW